MASGAVRELITKVKFQIDQASLSQVNKTLQEVKKNLASISDKPLKVGAIAETSKASNALKKLKTQADNVSTTTSNIKIGVENSKAQNALKDVKRKLASVSDKSLRIEATAETSKAQSALKNLKAQAENVAATTSNIKIGADTAKASNALKDVKNQVDKVSTTASKVKVNADTGKANSALKDLKRQADNVTTTTSNIKIGADVSNANAALKGIKNNIAGIGKEKSVTISADTGKTESALKNIKASFAGISKDKKILLDATTDKANAKLNKFKTTLDAVKAKKTNVKVNADTGKANTALQRLKRTLNDIKANVKAKVNIDAGNANSTLARIKGQLNSLQGKTVTTYVQTKQKGASASAVAKGGGKGSGNGGGSQFGSDFAGGLGVGLMTAGTAAGVAVAAAGAAAASATKKFADFDATMSKVRALTKASDTDMRALTETARKLGATTKYSATEAAEAMTYLGMAGWKSKDIMKAMPGLLDLAAASGEDLARVSDIVSDDLTAFKMPAEQAGHFADVLAVASSNANTNVSLMGETFKYVGPLAGSLGYSIEDMALATGIMANGSIKGEQAGTTLRALLTRLVKPTKESAMAMERLGLNIIDTNGKMKPFRQILADMRKGFSKLSEAEKGEVAAMLAGQEAMSGTLLLANENQSTIDNLTKSLDNSNGAAKEMAGVMNNNLNGAMKELDSSISEIALSFGEILEPSVRDAVKGMTTSLQGMAKDLEPYMKILRGPVGDTTEALEESRAEIEKLEGEHPTFVALIDLFKQIGKNVEETKTSIDSLGESLANAFGNETVQAGAQKILELLKKFAEMRGEEGILALTPIGAGTDALKVIAGAIAELFGNLLKNVLEFLSNVLKGVAEFCSNMIKSFGDAISNINTQFSNMADNAIANINRIADGLITLERKNDALRIKLGQTASLSGATNNTQNINVETINVPTAADVGKGVGSLADVSPWG